MAVQEARFFALTSSQPSCREPIYTMAPATAPAPTVLRELSVPRYGVLSQPPAPLPQPEPARTQPSASHHLNVPEAAGAPTHRDVSPPPPLRSVNERLPPTLRVGRRRSQRWLSEDTPVTLANGSRVRIPLKGTLRDPLAHWAGLAEELNSNERD